MPSTMVPTATAIDHSLRSMGFDLTSFLKSVDVQTVGVLALLLFAGVLLFDLFNYGYSAYSGNTSTYASYGRSLITSAAHVWDERDQQGLHSDGRGSRNLDSTTQILDSLAKAVLKYEELADNVVQN